MKEKNKCRTVEEITEEILVVQELDERIANNGGLIYKVLRKNLISHEQNNDTTAKIMKYVEDSKESPSLVYLLRFKTLATLAVLAGLYFFGHILFRMIEHWVPIQKLVESLLP